MIKTTKNRLKHVFSLLLSPAIVIAFYAQIPIVSRAATYSSWNQLQAAIDSGSETTFTLTKDIAAASDVSSPLTFPGGKNWVLDLNGHTLNRGRTSAESAGHVIDVAQDATLTILDSSGNNSGKITGGKSDGNAGGICVYGTLNLEGGTITGNSCSGNGGGIYVKGGTVNMTGGAIEFNQTKKYGGGIFSCEHGTVQISAGDLKGNTAGIDGGGIHLNNTAADIKNANLLSNSAKKGGGLFVTSGSSCTLTDSAINSNTSSERGGGIAVQGKSTLDMNNCTLSSNTSASEGGNICTAEGSTFTMNGGTVEKGVAPRGGGIYLRKTTAEIANVTITGNKSAMEGGGIYVVEGQNYALVDSVITGNIALTRAGGILVLEDASLNLTGCTISKNSVMFCGGGIYSLGTLNLDNCKVEENTAASGGGFYLAQNSKTAVNYAWVSENKANTDGGGVWVGSAADTKARFDSTNFNKNTAGVSGGGLYTEGEGTLILNECGVKGNTAEEDAGGGMYLESGKLKLALLGADIQNNTAYYCGGVFSKGAIISMKGYVVINNNVSKALGIEQKDLLLAEGSYIANPGLYARSHIHVASAQKTIAKDVSKYQKKYFDIDGDTVFAVTDVIDTPVIGSIFGRGSIIIAVGIAAAGAAAIAAAVILKKRKKEGALSHENSGDNNEE